eukprot:ANDGO_00891.mRNA.1 DEAD-box ATP-dependent RNA helicase 36
MTTFASLGIPEHLSRTLSSLHIREPTPIQQLSIPAILSGRNVLGIAQTGSGKTAAFALPILHKLSKDPYGVFALILTPTRELAFQISEQVSAFGISIKARVTVVTGGQSMSDQEGELAQKPHFVVATPGRLLWLLKHTQLRFNKLKYLVLDEADRLLDDAAMGLEVDEILSFLNGPETRQTLFFSATCSTALKTISDEGGFFFAAPTVSHSLNETLDEYFWLAPQSVKDAYLVALLRKFLSLHKDKGDGESKGKGKGKGKGMGTDRKSRKSSEADDSEDVPKNDVDRTVVVFVATCRTAQLLYYTLRHLEIDAAPLHSLLKQSQRIASLGKFRSLRTRILICTDVASRGLDIPSVSLVVNYDVPPATEDYVHRVGRTARAGRRGTAVSLVTQHDVERVQAIEAKTERKLESLESKPFLFLKDEIVEDQIGEVLEARKKARLTMVDGGWDEKVEEGRERKRIARDEVLRRKSTKA